MTTDLLLWSDVETNGLVSELGTDGGFQVLEVAFVITDTDFQELGSFERLVLPRTSVLTPERKELAPTPTNLVADAYLRAGDFVRDMHAKNGLWAACENEGEVLDAVVRDAVAWVKGICEDTRPLLGGASIHADREFLREGGFQELLDVCHYRSFDVSTLKRLCEWWPEDEGPELPTPPESAVHRAMYDIRFSIEEAKAVRRYLFRS